MIVCRLPAVIVDDFRKEFLSTPRHVRYSLLGGAVVPGAARWGRMRGRRCRKARRGERWPVIGVGGVGVGIGSILTLPPLDAETIGSKDVRDWGQSVARLRGRDVVDVRGVGEVGRLVGHMAGHGLWLMPAGEALIERCGLDDSFVGELLMGGGHNGQSIWRPFLGSRGRFQARTKRIVCGASIAIRIGRFGCFLQPRLDDVPLLVPDRDASL